MRQPCGGVGWHGREHTAVELIGLGVFIGQLVTGVSDGILEAAGLSVLAGELDVEGVDEEGGCRNHEDEATLPALAKVSRVVLCLADGCQCPLDDAPVLVGELKGERHRGRLFV